MNTAVSPALQAIPRAFLPYRQFVNWFLSGKDKIPCDVNGNVIGAHDSQHWLDAQTACSSAYGVAFVFTENDPFFFVDVDNAYDNHTRVWSDLANWTAAQFPGAAVEISQSGRGLHVFGSGSGALDPSHGTRRAGLPGLEIYTHGRFVALTGVARAGDAGVDFSGRLPGFLAACGLRAVDEPYEAVSGRDAAYTGPEDDTELVRIMCGSDKSFGQMFGGKATARQLWERDVPALERAFGMGGRGDGLQFDHSAADAALMYHLAFWTGRDQPRMQRLFESSPLYRPGKYTGKGVRLMPRVLSVGCRNTKVFDAPRSVTPPLLVPPALALPAPPSTKIYRETNILPITPPELIKRLLPAEPGLVAMILGQSGAGKSFYACALAVALAGSPTFLDMPVRENVGVIIIAAEGAGTIDARIFAAKREAGLEGKQLPIAIIPNCGDLANEKVRQAVVEAIKRESEAMVAEGLCTRVGAILIDTLTAGFSFNDENDNSEANSNLKKLKEMGQSLGSIIIVVHHLGKDPKSGGRGASSFRGDIDTSVTILADRNEATGEVKNHKLSITKARTGPEGPFCSFELKNIDLGVDRYGDPYSTCVFTKIDDEKSEVMAKDTVFDECFKHVWATEPKTKVGELEGITDVNVRTEFIRRYPVDGDVAKRKAWSRALKEQCLTLKNYHTLDGVIFKTVKKRPIDFDKLFPNRSARPVNCDITCDIV